MLSSRQALRSTRAFRVQQPRIPRGGRRYASTDSSTGSPAAIGAISGAAAGIAGAYLYGYYWYSSSGMKTVAQSAQQTKDYLKQAQDRLREQAPEPDQALSWLRETSLRYASLFPFAKSYVNQLFDDLDLVREKHGEDVDKIVRQAYDELRAVSQKELSMGTAQEAWGVIEKYTAEIGKLAADAGSDIINNHPQLKEKFGDNFDQIKQMADQYGPEAKKVADETWSQLREILSSGWSVETVGKIQKLVDEKKQQLKKFGDEAWQKGLEQAKPYLDKNPKIKELIENNADTLKSGNAGELFNKVKDAVDSGNLQDLEGYVNTAVGKAKESGFGGIDQYLKKIPGADQVVPKLSELSEIAQKHGKDAEQILKDTINDISQVLQKRASEAQKVVEKAKKDAQ